MSLPIFIEERGLIQNYMEPRVSRGNPRAIIPYRTRGRYKNGEGGKKLQYDVVWGYGGFLVSALARLQFGANVKNWHWANRVRNFRVEAHALQGDKDSQTYY